MVPIAAGLWDRLRYPVVEVGDAEEVAGGWEDGVDIICIGGIAGAELAHGVGFEGEALAVEGGAGERGKRATEGVACYG